MHVHARHHFLSWGGPVQTTNRIERSYRWWALSAVLLVMFTASLSSTIVSTAVPTIVADLNGFELYGWVFTGFMLASTVTMPIAGKLSDVYGRRPIYMFGIATYLAGSALAGLSTTMLMLIGARVVAGAGGGVMMALSTATIGDIFSPRERGRWMGLVMGVFGVASIIGPTLGGTITDNLGWRWVFFVTLPLGVLAWLIAGIVLPRVHTGRHHSVDYAGSLWLVASLVALLLGVTWGGTTYAWRSWQELVLFGVGGLLLVVFVLAERRAEEPVMSPELFRNRVFAFSVVISFCVGLAMFGSLTFIPLFVQGVIGKSAQNSGVILTPMMLSYVAAAAVGGWLISKTGRYKGQGVVGMSLAVGGLVLFAGLTPSTSSGEVVRDMIVLGVGIGIVMPILSIAVQSAFPHSMLGTVNASRQFFVNLGSAIGVPVMTAVIVNTFHSELPSHVPPVARQVIAGTDVDPLTAESQTALHERFAHLGAGGQAAYAGFVHGVRSALCDGIVDVFVLAVAFGVVALLFALVFPVIKLTQWDETSSPATEVEAVESP